MNQETQNTLSKLIVTPILGCQVVKISGKPFKSGKLIATVRGVTINPYTGNIALTFKEDNTCVDLFKCKLLNEEVYTRYTLQQQIPSGCQPDPEENEFSDGSRSIEEFFGDDERTWGYDGDEL